MSKGLNHSALLLVTAFIFTFAGCGIYTDISTNTDAGTDFSKYRTFAWLPDKTDTSNHPYNNEIIRNNIRNYFGQSFSERGYTVNLDTPDVLLKVVITNQKKEKTIIYPYYDWPYYYGNYYYGSIYYFPYEFNYYYRPYPFYIYPPDYYNQTYEYIEGSITLNVIERKQNKMVWSGTAKGDIYDPAYINKNIHPAVEAIMKKYPTKPISNKKKIKNNNAIDNYK